MRGGWLPWLCLSMSIGNLALSAEPATSAPPPPGMKDVPLNMRPYVVAFVVAGPSYSGDDGPERRALLEKHRGFVRRLVEQEKLRLAGPFTDDGSFFGLAIVAAKSSEEARAWLDEDPAVQAGVFRYETHPAFLPSLEGLRVRY